MPTTIDLDRLTASAARASQFVSAIANEKRLLTLCHLMDGERTVSDLANLVGLSQSALSQHLIRMRLNGLVETRRENQSIYYRLADPRVEALLRLLYKQFCEAEQ